MKKGLVVLILLLVLASCTGQSPVPPGECLHWLEELIKTNSSQAWQMIQGRSLTLNLAVGAVSKEGTLSVQESDALRMMIDLGQETAAELQTGQVLTVQGTAAAFSDGFLPVITLSPARVVTDTFQVTEKIQTVYTDVNGTWRKYCVFDDHGVLPGRQLVVFLPEDSELSPGDRITATGKLRCAMGLGFAMAPNVSVSEMLFMDEPVIERIVGEADSEDAEAR